jgi:hypothetical protein
VWKEKSAYHMIGPNGEAILTKKSALTDLEKGEGIWCFKSKKQWVFVSDAGTILLEIPKGKSLMWYNNTFVIEQPDTMFAIDRLGNRYAMTPEGSLVGRGSFSGSSSDENGYTVVSEDGRQGVKSASGEVLVVPKYEAILGKEGEHFVVEIAPGKGVYTYGLKEVVPPVYDEVIPLNADCFLLRSGRSYGIYTISGDRLRPLEKR